MGKIVFIVGGARSGKSSFAVKLAKETKGRVAFIATCQAKDAEMAKRIELHKKNRPKEWVTYEEPYGVSGLLNKISVKCNVILIDCLTLFVSNLMLRESTDRKIIKEAKDILSALKKKTSRAIIVSNEVGLGIVPQNKLGREFRDLAGRVNQIFATGADEVFFMASGIPWKIKNE